MNFKSTRVGLALLALFSFLIAVGRSLLMGPPTVRVRTMDHGFTYRMGAGYPGDVNRTHPFSVVPGLVNTTNPPRLVGDPVLVNTADNTLRGIIAGDQSDATGINIAGVEVRTYPIQQLSGGPNAAFGTQAGPTSGVADFIESGFVLVKLPAGVVVTKGQKPYIWAVATSGNNIQGGFVGALSAGNTVPVNNARFTGPADATGIAELRVWNA